MTVTHDGKASYGLIHVYTGDGKGKTTAALGLTLRAVGAGLQVLFVQFMKKGRFSEVVALERLGVTVRQYGSGRFVKGRPEADDRRRAEEGLAETARLLAEGGYSMVVLDEVLIAASLGIVGTDELIRFLDSLPRGCEVVMTGRNAPEEILRRADLVTECRKVKHYYDKGVKARTGIEK